MTTGILTKANDAKRETEIAEVKERAQLDIASWVADKMEKGEDATVNTPDRVKEILDTANPDTNNRYYKEVTDEGVVTPNDYLVPIGELYTNGTGYTKAGTEVEEKPSEWESTQVTAIADGQGGVIPLPDNFYYVGGTKSDGIVISDNPADAGRGTSHEVAQTLQGNQFVWVPVENEEYFKTYDGYRDKILQQVIEECEEPYSGGNETEKTEYYEMRTKVFEYNGFYIGRYESGVDSVDERTEKSGIDDAVVIKQGKNVYNFIGWSNSNDMTIENGGAVEKSRNFDAVNGYESVKSTLIYGVQWDSVMQWFDLNYRNHNSDLESFVVNSTGGGNYYDIENKNEWKGKLAKTGSSSAYKKNNIYDLAGNAREWTMESYQSSYRIRRGGYYNNSGLDGPVSDRAQNEPSNALEFNGFRICLYIK